MGQYGGLSGALQDALLGHTAGETWPWSALSAVYFGLHDGDPGLGQGPDHEINLARQAYGVGNLEFVAGSDPYIRTTTEIVYDEYASGEVTVTWVTWNAGGANSDLYIARSLLRGGGFRLSPGENLHVEATRFILQVG